MFRRSSKAGVLAVGVLTTVALVAGCGQGKSAQPQPPRPNPQLQSQQDAAAKQLQMEKQYNYASGVAGWDGLYPAVSDWATTIKAQTVQDFTGKNVPMPVDKPILFVSYWCPNCHNLLKLLESNGLLGKVQVVAVGFEFDENKAPGTYKIPKNVAEAQTILDSAMKQAGIHLDTKKVLYGLPAISIYPPQAKVPADQQYPITPFSVDASVHAYPTFLISHGGKDYVWDGDNANVQFWQTALQGGDGA